MADVIEALIDGGKASAAPPLGPALGPMGVNIGQVIAEINKKTEHFKGMQVPVKVIVDKETKSFEITVGTPPASTDRNNSQAAGVTPTYWTPEVGASKCPTGEAPVL